MSEGPPFEQCFARLEQIVQTLQQGGLPLEEAMALFEEGMSLARLCNQHLAAAELKVTQLQAAFQESVQDQEISPDLLP
jgi:exodeoxyribonuclease VII small subunit